MWAGIGHVEFRWKSCGEKHFEILVDCCETLVLLTEFKVIDVTGNELYLIFKQSIIFYKLFLIIILEDFFYKCVCMLFM